MKTVLVGITKIHSKKANKDFCILHFVSDGDQFTQGSMVSTEFVDPKVADYDLIGHDINIIYGKGYGGKAVVEGIELA